MRLEASHVRCDRECLHEKMLFRMIRLRLDVALGLFESPVLLTKGAPIARTAEMGILKVTHRHSHAASETEIGALVDVGMGSAGEGRGEGLGMGTCVGMGMGNGKLGRGVGYGVGCEEGREMCQSSDQALNCRVLRGRPGSKGEQLITRGCTVSSFTGVQWPVFVAVVSWLSSIVFS